MKNFNGSFTQQEPIDEEGIQSALEVLRSGKIHRYNVEKNELSETALLEQEFAQYLGSDYCLSCASCGSAMYLALKSIGVQAGDKVLCNAYTLAPVPGAIQNAGATIELVDITDNYTIDLSDLENKAKAPDVKWLLLSHMRGHITDMDQVMKICADYQIQLIEDCAHTMGASWDGKKSGAYGKVACFSTQTYKHINSGEGGLLITNDPEIIARAIIYSGSYMLYERHLARPPLAVFESIKKVTPNYSCRMDNLRSAILRPQLKNLDKQVRRWNLRYKILEQAFSRIEGICCPSRDPKEAYVGSSIQFSLSDQSEEVIKQFLTLCSSRGVELKWFGDREPVGFTSAYSSWEYWEELPELKNTNRILKTMCDMRIPLTFSEEDCLLIAAIIEACLKEVLS